MRFSKEEMPENLIGNLYFEPISFEDILEIGEKQIYNLGVSPNDILIIDDQIIVAGSYYNFLAIYDKQFNLVKIIDTINGETFSPIAVASNLEDRIIFICEDLKDRILMIDFDFNFIKSVDWCGQENNQFNFFYRDICYKNECLYICDTDNKRVQIYSKDLVLVKSIELDYKPWKIEASNSIICVNTFCATVHFYNLNDFSFIRSYEHGDGRISKINSCFYELINETKSVYCYDENGILKEEINLFLTILFI